jgi:hypothetical protein
MNEFLKLDRKKVGLNDLGIFIRVARFFFTQYIQRGKIYQTTTTLPNGHKICQMAIKYAKWP